MNVIDLFSGVGGLSLGFEQNGFNVIFANEINKDISYSYKKNFPKTECLTKDILQVDLKKEFSRFKKKVSIIIGGPPCQGLSQKGKRKWFSDKRNFLFNNFLHIVEIVQPEFVLIENVPNLITADNGFFLKEISKIFDKINYKINAKILEAKRFGVPQIRRRAFILARRKNIDFELEETNGLKTYLGKAIDDLPKLKSGEGIEFVNYNKQPFTEYQKIMRLGSSGVWNHISTNHSKIALQRMQYMKIGGTRLDLPKEHLTGSIYSGTWSRLDPNSFARTITTRFDTPSSGQFTLPFQDRCLTVREAARVQSFPDNFIFYGKKTNQMIQVGNAVPPLISNNIAKLIKKHL
jgi:DNA (cytosine-5)-methyltransferase 1